MTDPRDDRRDPEDDGDTQMFQAFVDRRNEPPARSGSGFRLVTLALGLVIFVLIVWLLLG